MVGGFILGGNVSKQVLIRGFGPTLSSFGVTGALANPVLELYWDHDNNPTTAATLLVRNDDWGTAANAATLQASGFAPANSLESAVYVSLAPGAYMAIVSGAGSTLGVRKIGFREHQEGLFFLFIGSGLERHRQCVTLVRLQLV